MVNDQKLRHAARKGNNNLTLCANLKAAKALAPALC
jgi:hypothetical protein